MLSGALGAAGNAILADSRRAVLVAVALVGVIAYADYATGYAVRLAILYLLPVFLATWTAGRLPGTFIAILATLAWMLIFRSSHPYSQDFHYYWEGAILLCTLIAFAFVLARLREALEHADERFVTVLEGLDAAVYVSEAGSGALLYTNRRFVDYFSERGVIHNVRAFEQAFDVRPPDFLVRSTGPQSDAGRLQGEFHDSATGRWFLVQANSVIWIDGRRVSLKVLADITDSRNAEEAARQQMERLQQSAKLLTIGEMASGLAHELNQPLTAIASYNQGCLRLLQSENFDRAELQGYMEKCGAQAVRAGAIIHRIRGFVKKREASRGPNDLNAIIGEAVQLIEMEAAKNGVRFALDLAPGLPQVLADSIMIEQVLVNLIQNGIQAMEETGAKTKRIAIRSARASDTLLQVSVADDGRGIPAEVADQLYTAFFSTKQTGMGVGLNICRSIVEFHGGKLWHESGTGPGTTFHFTVPVLAA